MWKILNRFIDYPEKVICHIFDNLLGGGLDRKCYQNSWYITTCNSNINSNNNTNDDDDDDDDYKQVHYTKCMSGNTVRLR